LFWLTVKMKPKCWKHPSFYHLRSAIKTLN